MRRPSRLKGRGVMNTQVILVDQASGHGELVKAGQALAQGALVAFPTETVYGLGASAFLPGAVAEIFRLKGRPADNPLIVHLLSADWLDRVAGQIPELFWPLYQAFSPGPLTYVLPRHPSIPDIVTSGLHTVAVRFPSQRAARDLLQAAGVPIVAPSANLSGRPSPTRARHVLDDFAGRIPFLIDDGPCEVGVESTVLDLTCDPPKILRPGKITARAILEATGIGVDHAEEKPLGTPRSPGMKYRHYAPDARVAIAMPDEEGEVAGALLELARQEEGPVGLFLSEAAWESIHQELTGANAYTYEGERDPEAATRALYDALRTLDSLGVELIVAEGFAGEEASAYMDRLKRASEVKPATRQVLFICEGNTCRSPMAEAIFNDRFESEDVRASSAGLAVIAGQVMADQSVQALAEWGIEAQGRRARQLRARAVRDADLIVTMTENQRSRLAHYFPEAEAKLLSMAAFLDGREVSDPYGQPLYAYRKVRDEMGGVMDAIRDRLFLV